MEEGEAIDFGHHEIEQDQRGRFGFEQIECDGTVFSFVDCAVIFVECALEDVPCRGIIFDDHDGEWGVFF